MRPRHGDQLRPSRPLPYALGVALLAACGGHGDAAGNGNLNNNGGPATCKWSTNNCGPNDEPFSFHVGGCHALMGDGAVRFISENIDAWMPGTPVTKDQYVYISLWGRDEGGIVGAF